MGMILNVLGLILLALISWFAIYVVVFTVSSAWHEGVNRTQEKEKKLQDIARELDQKAQQLIKQIAEQAKPTVIH